MFDGWVRRRIDPVLDRLGGGVARRGIGANAVTCAAAVLGLASALAVASGFLGAALILMLASRFLDGLDGAVARQTRPTDLGGFLDIVLDFLFYGAFPLGFVLLDPAANAVAGAALILAFYVNGASFLAYAVMAARRGLTTDVRGGKSLFFTTGLAEGTETIAVFAAFCVFPDWFPAIAYAFAGVTAYTTLSRIALAARTLRD